MVKFSIYRADITKLKIEAIVNAANETGLGCSIRGHCIDSAIHFAAGPQLYEECKKLDGIPTGVAKITKAYNLPCKYIIHVTGPRNAALGTGLSLDIESSCDFKMLAQCYISCLEVAKANNIKEIAFSGISTGLFGFPKTNSAIIAVKTIMSWLKESEYKFDHIIFDVFTSEDHFIYQNVLDIEKIEYQSLTII